MIAVEDRQITSAWSNSLRMLIVLLSMAAFISLFRLADMTALQRHGSVPPRAQAALPAAPPHGMKVVIGKEVLTVPAAAMRFAPNAGNGAAGAGTPPETQLVELNLSWPALEPLAPGQRGIYLSLSARADPIQPRERFQRNGKPNAYAWYDVGQALAHLTVQAQSEGIAVHQMAGFDRDRAREVLGIPEGWVATSAAAVGYYADPGDLPEEEAARLRGGRSRKARAELLFRGRFAQAEG